MGTALPASEGVTSSKYERPKLSKNTPLDDSFRLVMGNVLDHIHANIAAAQQGDAEGIHQLRIGIRRARSALRLYQMVLPFNMYTRFDRRLRNYGRAFGEARDWDVLLTETMAEDWPAIPQIRARAAPAQCHLRQQVNALLKPDQHFSVLIQRMGSWADSVQLVETPMRAMAPKMLTRLATKVRKRRKRARRDDLEALHRLRKSAKWLRYSVEFVGGLYGKRKVNRYLSTVKQAMDQLGVVNDAIVAERLLRKMNLLEEVRPMLKAHQRRTLKQVPKAMASLKREAFWA